MKNLKPWYALGILAYVVAWYIPVFLCSRQTIFLLSREDHPLEWTGTIACLIASVVFLIGYWKYSAGNDFGFFSTRRNLFLLLLGLMLFAAFGEELSWGQRLFHFMTPAAIRGANKQQEFNLHNLKWFMHGRSSGLKWLTNPQTLFTLFWDVYGLFIPLFCALSSQFRAITRRLNLPIMPIWLGVGFVINSCMWLGIVSRLPGKGSIEEFMEGVIETLIMFVAIRFLYDVRNRVGWANKPE